MENENEPSWLTTKEEKSLFAFLFFKKKFNVVWNWKENWKKKLTWKGSKSWASWKIEDWKGRKEASKGGDCGIWL